MKTKFSHFMVALLPIALLVSCTKEQTEAPVNPTAKQVIVRIKQVEKNNTVVYSPLIRVQVKP